MARKLYAPQTALLRPSLDFFGTVSMCRREFQHDADMNVIVNKFLTTGELPAVNAGRPSVDGLSAPGDFTEACNLAFEQRNVEIQQRYEQETLALQNGESQVSSSAGVQDGTQDGQAENSQVEQPDKAL